MAEHFVAAESDEIGVDRLHIERPMRHMLRGIDQHQRASRVGTPHNLFDRVDRAQDIRHGSDRDETSSVGQEPVELVELQQTIVGDGNMF